MVPYLRHCLFVFLITSLLYAQDSANYINIKKVVVDHQALFDKTKYGFVDLHNTLLLRLFELGDPAFIEDSNYIFNTSWIKKSGLKLIFLSIGTPRFSPEHQDTVSIIHIISFLRSFKYYILNNQSDFTFVNSTDQAIDAIKENKICFVFAIEGLHLINYETAWIDSLYDLGVRMIGIAHTFCDQIVDNTAGFSVQNSFVNDSSTISAFGREVIERLIEKGILIDLSHLGTKSFGQAVDYINGRQPLVVSHTASKKLVNNFRNLTDEQLTIINKSNGIVGVIFHSPFLTDTLQASIKDFNNHYYYFKQKLSSNSVYIGSDLGGNINPFKNYEQFYKP